MSDNIKQQNSAEIIWNNEKHQDWQNDQNTIMNHRNYTDEQIKAMKPIYPPAYKTTFVQSIPVSAINPPLTGGIKHDSGKVDLTYMSIEWMELHCRVRMFGDKKYSRNNWMLGFEILRSLAAALRHLFAFMWGEDNDPESGLCHLGHVSNCLEHAYHDFLYRKQNDNRAKSQLFKGTNE